ncbi:MAG: glycosyltransferase family 4 protein [Burkholderiales bacterium]
MKLVFFNRYYWPDRSATSQLLTDLATALAAAGHDVVVVAGDREQDPAAPRLPSQERDRGVEIRRLRVSALARFGLFGRALDYAGFYVAAQWFALRHVKRGDVVIAKTDPPLLGAILTPVLRLKGAALLNWLQDLYPEVAEQLGVLRPSIFTALLRRLRDVSLRSARINVVIGERMRERVAAVAGAARAIVVHNWSPPLTTATAPAPDNDYRRQLGLGNAVLFVYSGNLGRAHRFEALLAAGEHLRERRELRFLVIGDGPQKAAVEAEARTRGLANWSFLPLQPRERLAESLGAADVHLISLEPKVEGLIVPSKIYGVMAAGRPCIFVGAPDGEVAELLRRHECGIAVHPDDPVALVLAVEQLARDVALRKRMGSNAKRAFDERFTIERALERWREVLESHVRST